ncbi:MAG: hypothetical protein WA121_02655 [Syntrophales bacterium]
MEIRTQVTNKQLDFIDNIDLRKTLLERLSELDRIFLVNATYSTVFVAIGAIEGILKHIAAIYKNEIKKNPSYPKNSKGNVKRWDDLTLDEVYEELKNMGILPDISEYKYLYFLFRNYRNCIHPQAQVHKGWDIQLGQAQMALGLLNATIQHLDRNIFIGKHIFEKLSGAPYYDSGKMLHLKLDTTPHHSFLVLKKPVSQKLRITFDLELSRNSLLNIVFNYVNDGDFKMVRLDNRRLANCPNAVLKSTQKYVWHIVLSADPEKPPEKEQYQVSIQIDIPNRVFELIVDGQTYIFKDSNGNPIQLIDQVTPSTRVGFFNEEGPAKLSNIAVDIA